MVATIHAIGTTFTGTTTAWALPYPTVSAGDILIASLTMNGAATQDVATPSGWNRAYTSPTDGGTAGNTNRTTFQSLYVFWKAATGSETGSQTFTSVVSLSGSGAMLSVSGADTTSPFEVSNFNEVTDGVSLSAAAAITTSATELLVTFMADDSGSTVITPPSGWTSAWNQLAGQSNSAAYLPNAAAGTYTPTWTLSAQKNMSIWSAGIRSAGAGGPQDYTITPTDALGLRDSVTGVTPAGKTLPAHITQPSNGFPVELESGSVNPVFIDGNGNLYKFMEGPPDASLPNGPLQPCAMKSADGGQTWVASDQTVANSLSSQDQEGTCCRQVGTTIYYSQMQNPSNPKFMAYNTSDHPTLPDKWVNPATLSTPATVENIYTGGSSESGIAQWNLFTRLSDGSMWFVWAGNLVSTNQQLLYAKRTVSGGTASYTAPTNLHSGASVSNAFMVTDSNDLTYIFYTDNTNGQALYRTLTAGGTLSGSTRVDTTGLYLFSTDYARSAFKNGVTWNADGHVYVAIIYTEANGNLWLALFTDGVLSREQITTAAVAAGGGAATSETPTAHLARDGSVLYVAYCTDSTGVISFKSRSAAGVWSGATTLWNPPGGTPSSTTEWAGTMAEYVYLSVLQYPSGTKVLGYAYDKGVHANSVSYVDYNEYTLTSTPVLPTSTWSRAISVRVST